MSDKDFKVKNKLQVKGITSPGPITSDSSGNIDSVEYIATQYGGTGTSTSPNSGQILYSSSGTNYAPTTLNTLDVKGSAYQTSAPSNPVTGQLWVDSDETGDSLDPYIIRRKTITATAGQTVFTTDVVFTDGYEQIYYNGVLLVRTTDYTTSGGTNTVTLLQGASAGDTIEIISSTPINLVNAITSSGGTITAPSASTVPLTIAGAASQTANYFEIKNSVGEIRQELSATSMFSIRGYETDPSGIEIYRYGNSGPVAALGLRAAGGTFSSPSALPAGSRIGLISSNAHDGTNYLNAARITFALDGTVTTGSVPSMIQFNTSVTGGAGSHVERMRITSAGNVGIGTDNPQARLHSIAAAGGSPLLLGMVTSDTTSWIQPKLQRNGYGQQAAWLYTPSTVNSSNPVWYTGLNASSSHFTFSTFDATNFIERMHISPNGNIAIGDDISNLGQWPSGSGAERGIEISTATGTNSPVLRFHRPGWTEFKMGVPGANNNFYLTNNNGVSNIGSNTNGMVLTNTNGFALFGYSSSNGSFRVQVNSQIFATSSSISTSDGRYKEEVNTITNGLSIVDSLRPVSFKWKDHPVHNFVTGKTVGFIAQEVQEALADYDWADNIIKSNYNEETEEEFLGIAEANIIPLLVSAVKELKAEFEEYKRLHP